MDIKKVKMSTFSREIIFFTVVLIFGTVCSERVKSKIYDNIDGIAACYRRLNGTHQFGCTSHRQGNVGIVHFIENQESLKWLLDKGNAVPYMAVMYPTMFTREVLLKLKESNKINGIALLNDESLPNNFSHEDTCPNRYSGYPANETCDAKDSKDVWNPYGTKLLLEDWGYPIFFIKKDAKKILDCYNKFNANETNKYSDRSLCALEMNSFMFATTNSETCIRRSKLITNLNPMRFCDPLSSRNIWSTLFPRNKTASSEEKGLVYVIASRMDASSLFDGITPGAVSPVTGMVALMSTAQILSQIIKTFTEPVRKNVLFVLFNGEAFDYVGSSRMVWDMKAERFPVSDDDGVSDQPPPLRLEHLAYFIELSHLTNQYKGDGSGPSLVFHSSKKNTVRSQVSTASFVTEMKEIGSRFKLQFTERKDGKLPPASLQTFIKEGGNDPVPGVVIADYYNNFTTRYYHSIYDDNNALNYEYQNGSVPGGDSIQSFVGNISTALSYTLFKMLTGENYNGTVQADLKIIDELFHCYLESANCSLFQNASYKAMLVDEPANFYIGVNPWRGHNYQVTTLTGQALAYLTGNVVNKTEKECHNNPLQQIFQYIWVMGNNDTGVCMETTMNYSAAMSPAFEETEYDWSSGRYSTWTESVWSELGMRMFLKPSRDHEVKIFSIGAVVFGLSFIIVYFLNSRSHILFGNTLGTGVC